MIGLFSKGGDVFQRVQAWLWAGTVALVAIIYISEHFHPDWWMLILEGIGFTIVALPFGYLLAFEIRKRRLPSSAAATPRWINDKALGDELHGWLRESGFTLRENAPDPGCSFNILATDRADRPVTITKIEGDPGIIFAILLQTENPAERKIVEAMTEDQFESMKEEIGIELARMGVGFDARDFLGQGVRMEYRLLTSESMTRWQFLERITFFTRSMLIVQLVTMRHVRRAQLAS